MTKPTCGERGGFNSCAGGQFQMLRCVVHLFWSSLVFTFVIISLLLPVEVQAQQPFSSNPDDYDFGWFTSGVHDSGPLPICSYCFNAWGAGPVSLYGPDLNRTVVLYQCEGAYINQIWAYQSSSKSIVYSNLTEVLCLDAALWPSQVLVLLPCNSSLVSQRWKYENHRLTNGLVDSNGNILYIVGIPPANDQLYNQTLFITNSDTASKNGLSSDFTFLSSKNMVDLSTQRLTTEGLGLPQMSNSHIGQVVNGGFENSTISLGYDITESTGVHQIAPNYFALCGWVIEYGPIGYVRYPPAASGSLFSVHLNTDIEPFWGSISQTIETEVGKAYVLSFCMTGYPSQVSVNYGPTCNAIYSEARLQVQVTNASTTEKLSVLQLSDGALTQNFTADAAAFSTGSSRQNMGWNQETVTFIAWTNLTTVSFTSLNFNDTCGPMIDTVDVSPMRSSPRRSNVVGGVGGSIGGLVGLIAVLGIVCGIRYRRARDDYSGLYNTEHGRVYSMKELRIATKHFSSVLGEGGFGTVYKADFPDGTGGAVKVEKPHGPNSPSKVLASEEIVVLLRVHHRNLVNLIGFCIHNGRHLLVFEYLPNGNLHDRLHKSTFSSHRTTSTESHSEPLELHSSCFNVIPWKKRMKIASDVACGLEYLHHEANPPIGHRDVKSQNILFTATDSVKLVDFGLSKATLTDATSFQSFQSIETAVKGSFGYMDPQYFCTGVFSPKSDVYSFGVVLLELISGRPAIQNAVSLVSWAAPYWTNPSRYHELVDKKLNGEYDAKELESLVELSKLCTQEDGKMRPNMRQVVAFLNEGVPSIGEESPQQIEKAISRESYQEKVDSTSIDLLGPNLTQ